MNERLTTTTVHDLPGDDVFPEGIAVDAQRGVFFVSGARSGAIYQGDLATGAIETLMTGDRREPLTTIGLDLSSPDRLWVAGGASGNVYLFDARSGEHLQTFSSPPARETFINDLVVGASGDVYATDSLRPTLFRVRSGSFDLEPWLDLGGTEFESRERGSDANGVVVTGDEEYLIVVKTGTGQVFRIETRTGRVREIDLGDEAVTGGDGLVLDGQKLYVVCNSEREVALVELRHDLLSGRVAVRITDQSFEFPTTAAKVGDELLVVNSQFDVMDGGTPRLPFRVSRVRVVE